MHYCVLLELQLQPRAIKHTHLFPALLLEPSTVDYNDEMNLRWIFASAFILRRDRKTNDPLKMIHCRDDVKIFSHF